MTLAWVDLNLISDNLIAYFFSTQLFLALAVLFFFLTLLVGSGIDFKISLLTMLPLVAAYAVGGVLGANTWILHVSIMIAGFVYTSALVKVIS